MTDPARVAELAEARHRLHERIAAAGGSIATVRLVAVSKTRPVSDVLAALEAGFSDLGESYASEFAAKAAELVADPVERRPHWHFIGQLQTNKVRVIAPFAPLVQSVDRPSLVVELARRAPGSAVLVQVDLAGVAGRGGVAPTEAPALVEQARTAGLDVQGVMGVAPLEGGSAATAGAFRLLRGIADAEGLAECSMGMSGDLEIAVAEGSTMVRIGTDIFGSRPPV